MTDEVRRFADKEHAAFFARFINERDDNFTDAAPVQLKTGEWAVVCKENGENTLFISPLSYMKTLTIEPAAALHARRLAYTELVDRYSRRKLTPDGVE